MFIFLGAIFALVDNSLIKFRQVIEKKLIVSVLVVNSFLYVANADFVALIRSNFLLAVTTMTIVIASRYLIKFNKEKL